MVEDCPGAAVVVVGDVELELQAAASNPPAMTTAATAHAQRPIGSPDPLVRSGLTHRLPLLGFDLSRDRKWREPYPIGGRR